MEYEGLSTICFNCGCYGHLSEQCSWKEGVDVADNEGGMEDTNRKVPPLGVPEEKFELWLRVTHQGRKNDKKDNTSRNKDSTAITKCNGPGSHFDLIAEMREDNIVGNGSIIVSTREIFEALNDELTQQWKVVNVEEYRGEGQ